MVQQFGWKQFEGKFGLVLGWWNLCYLTQIDIEDYLNGARLSLSNNGCIILAEPISEITTNNTHNG
jgi:hypothetical protein